MKDLRESFISALISSPLDLVASTWIIDRIPFVFDEDRAGYAKWRCLVASGLGVDPSTLVIIGSGAVGISLSPNKNYRRFDETLRSDIDLAVISEYHFTEAWRALRNLGARRYGLSRVMREWVDEHRKNYIYWGTIATDRILTVLPFGSDWAGVLRCIKGDWPTSGRVVNARIYKDFESLRSYQVKNLKDLQSREFKDKDDVKISNDHA